MITSQELKNVLDYNEDTGIFVWNTARTNRIKVGSVAGCKCKDGYLRIRVGDKLYLAHRLAWIYMYDIAPIEVDHINHKRDDNRAVNLREADKITNGRNTTLNKSNTSGANGVYAKKDRWKAQIMVNGKAIHLGMYGKFEDAVQARKEADIKYGFHANHGDIKGL